MDVRDLTPPEKRVFAGTLAYWKAKGLRADVAEMRAYASAKRPLFPSHCTSTLGEKRPTIEVDAERRSAARARLALWEYKIRRGLDNMSFQGDAGLLLDNELISRYADDSEQGERYAMFRSILPTSFSFVHRAARTLSAIRNQPMARGGDMAEDEAFLRLMESSCFDDALSLTQHLAIALGCIVAKPTSEAGRRVTVRRVYPHEVSAFCMPDNPGHPGVIVEHYPDRVKVWDIREEGWPICRTYLGKMAHDLCSRDPASYIEGPAYTALWGWAGVPLLPHVIYPGVEGSTDLLPLSTTVFDGTIDIIFRALDIEWVRKVGLHKRFIALTSGILGAKNAEKANIEPAVLITIDGAKPDDKVLIMESAAKDAQLLQDQLAQDVSLYASQLNGDLQVQKREGQDAESGLALSIRARGLFVARQQQEMTVRPRDLQAIRVTVSTYNGLVALGQIADVPILEGEVTQNYPMVWTPEQREAIRKDMLEEIGLDLGTKTSRDLDIFHTGGNAEDPIQRQASLKKLLDNALEVKALRDAGLLQKPSATVSIGGGMATPEKGKETPNKGRDADPQEDGGDDTDNDGDGDGA